MIVGLPLPDAGKTFVHVLCVSWTLSIDVVMFTEHAT